MTLHRIPVSRSTALFALFISLISSTLSGQNLSYGDTRQDTLLTTGAEKIYSFAGTAGDDLLISMAGILILFDPEIRLFNPQGELIADATAENGPARLRITLPVSGTYTLHLADADDNDAGIFNGRFGINIQQLNGPAAGIALAFNDRAAAAIGQPAEVDKFLLDIPAATPFLLRFGSTNATFNPQLELYGPDGSLVWTDNSTDVFNNEIRLDSALVTGGTYTLLVMDVRGDLTFAVDYGIVFQHRFDPPGTVALVSGTATAATYRQLSEVDVFSFAGQSGEPVLLRLSRSSTLLNLKVELYAPDGSMFWSGIGGVDANDSSVRLDTVLDASGRYTLLVMDLEGNYNFGNELEYGIYFLHPVNGTSTSPLDWNTTRSGELSASVTVDRYVFDYTAGTSIMLRAGTGSLLFDPEMEIYAPDGSLIWHRWSVNETELRLDTVWQQSGQYTVHLLEYGGNAIGNAANRTYGITLLERFSAPVSPLALNTNIETTIEQLAEVDIFSIDLAADQPFILRAATSNLLLQPQLELYNPNNELVWSGKIATVSNGDLRLDTSFTMPGTYRLLCMELGANYAGVNQFYGLQILDRRALPAVPLTFDELQTGKIESLAQIDVYTFEVEASQDLLLRMGMTFAFIQPEIQIYDPSGILVYEFKPKDFANWQLDTVFNTAGLYTLFVMDRDGNYRQDFGNYELLLLDKFSTPATTIAMNSTIEDKIESPSDLDFFSFEAQAGESVMLRIATAFPSLNLDIMLYDPDQKLLWSAVADGGTVSLRLDTVLTRAGTYRMLISDAGANVNVNPTVPADYGISLLRKFDPGFAIPLPDTAVIPDTLQRLSEMALFSFEADPEASYNLSILTDFALNNDLRVEIYDHQFNILYDLTAAEATGMILRFPEATPYYLLVYHSRGSARGSFTIGLQKYQLAAIPYKQWYPFSIGQGFAYNGVVEVPAVEELYILVKKTNRTNFFRSWSGSLLVYHESDPEAVLVDDGKYTTFSLGGNADYDIYLADPKAGNYYLTLQAFSELGEGQLLITDELPELTLETWNTGQILRPYGYDWWTFDLPLAVDTLFLSSEGYGHESSIEIYYDFLENPDRRWMLGGTYSGNYSISGHISPAPAGRYFVRYKDSAVLTDTEGEQERTYLIRAGLGVVTEPGPIGLEITSLSTYTLGQGTATLDVQGTGFSVTDSVILINEAQERFATVPYELRQRNRTFTATFDLRSATPGEWQLLVLSEQGDTAIAPRPVQIEAADAPEIWVELVSRTQMRLGRVHKLVVRYGNRGRVDARNVLFYTVTPKEILYAINVPRLFDYPTQKVAIRDTNYFLIHSLPAGALGELEIELKANKLGEFPVEAGYVDLTYTAPPPPSPFTPHPDHKDPMNNEKSLPTDNYVPQIGDWVFQDFMQPVPEPFNPFQHAGLMDLIEDPDGEVRPHVIELLDDGYVHDRRWEFTPEERAEFQSDLDKLNNGEIDEQTFESDWENRGVHPEEYTNVDDNGQVTGELVDWGDLNGPDTFRGGGAPEGITFDQRADITIMAEDLLNTHNPYDTDANGDRLNPPLGDYNIFPTDIFPEKSNKPRVHCGSFVADLYDAAGAEFTGLMFNWPTDVLSLLCNGQTLPPPPAHIPPDEDRPENADCMDDNAENNTNGIIQNLLCIIGSITPEDKYGPTGFDLDTTALEDRRRFLPQSRDFAYRIDYWNREDATAPAAEVFIRDTLDENFDLSTFRFTEFGFLRWKIVLPQPGQYFNINVDLRPDFNLLVNVEGTLDPGTREVYWVHRSLDPQTLELPEDPQAGYLPPIDSTGYQVGWVSYRIGPDHNLHSGTEFNNQAFVNFDGVGPWGPAPPYGPYRNTFDFDAPESMVQPLEMNSPEEILVSWSGTDHSGSGIRDYTVYVSDNDAPYEAWLTNTTATSAVFNGEVGHFYRFYSTSRDYLGHEETAPGLPDASTLVITDIRDLATAGFHLHQNVPNPFRETTFISFELPTSTEVVLEVFDLLGRQLFQRQEILPAGLHTREWSLPDHATEGIFFYRLRAGKFRATKKMVRRF